MQLYLCQSVWNVDFALLEKDMAPKILKGNMWISFIFGRPNEMLNIIGVFKPIIEAFYEIFKEAEA